MLNATPSLVDSDENHSAETERITTPQFQLFIDDTIFQKRVKNNYCLLHACICMLKDQTKTKQG